ncbi:peptidyl-prolyl cis-trans isomerase [Massilia sp. H-1]|nr:peptidyl-prolyl cis-trans isomerase [Massilia sp. H-1]
MQGRMAFFARDTAFMAQQARSRVGALLIEHWARERFGDAALADLRQALSDQEDVRAAMGLYGLADGAEDVSPIQKALASEVTKADIRTWYKANKEQFRRVDRVRARHIRVATEAQAATLAGQVARGADFAALARAHSLAADAARGGALGWVRAWRRTVLARRAGPAAAEQARCRSRFGRRSDRVTTRTGKSSWLKNASKTTSLLSSETVRYLARKAIARTRPHRICHRAQSLCPGRLSHELHTQATGVGRPGGWRLARLARRRHRRAPPSWLGPVRAPHAAPQPQPQQAGMPFFAAVPGTASPVSAAASLAATRSKHGDPEAPPIAREPVVRVPPTARELADPIRQPTRRMKRARRSAPMRPISARSTTSCRACARTSNGDGPWASRPKKSPWPETRRAASA